MSTIRISAGQSACGGSVDWHSVKECRLIDGQWRQSHSHYNAFWGVSGYLEYPDTPDGWAAAEEEAAKIRQHVAANPSQGTDDVYIYVVGQWAPRPGVPRFSMYGPRDR